MLAKTRNSPNSSNIIARPNLLIYSTLESLRICWHHTASNIIIIGVHLDFPAIHHGAVDRDTCLSCWDVIHVLQVSVCKQYFIG